jgi:hypothetical protein
VAEVSGDAIDAEESFRLRVYLLGATPAAIHVITGSLSLHLAPDGVVSLEEDRLSRSAGSPPLQVLTLRRGARVLRASHGELNLVPPRASGLTFARAARSEHPPYHRSERFERLEAEYLARLGLSGEA